MEFKSKYLQWKLKHIHIKILEIIFNTWTEAFLLCNKLSDSDVEKRVVLISLWCCSLVNTLNGICNRCNFMRFETFATCVFFLSLSCSLSSRLIADIARLHLVAYWWIEPVFFPSSSSGAKFDCIYSFECDVVFHWIYCPSMWMTIFFSSTRLQFLAHIHFITTKWKVV